MSEYSTGRFRVYYLNTAGHEVPLANARYQILSEENVVVASGRTNSQGQTDAVRVEVKSRIRVAARDSFANSAGLVGLAVRAMLSSPDKLRYSLKLQVPGSQEFERPDYNVNQERYWLEISALRRENIVFGVRVNPYFRVQLRAGGGGQATPISGVDYIAYSGTTSDGRRIVATSPDGEQIRGRTDGHGRTGKHFYAGELQFEFALPGNLRRQTVPLKPLFKGGQYAIYHFDIGSQTARTERDRGATAHVSGMMGQPLVLVPDKDEALILPPEAWEELRALSNTIEGTMSAVHSARLNLNQALAANSAKAVEDAERALGIAEDHVAEMLNKDFSSTADLCEVITIENFDHGRTRGNGSFLDRVGWRRRYIPQKKYEELKRRRVRGVPIHVEMSTSVKAKNGGAKCCW